MSMRSHQCGQVTESLIGQEVTLAGWVNRRRDHGGVIFIDLRDRDGFVQVVCDPDRQEMFSIAEQVRNEFCVQIKGLVRARPAGTENNDLVSGKVELLCHELNILNASITPPFQLEDDNLSETTRLTHRVLDLRRPQMQKNLRLRYNVAIETRKYLDQAGFIDIETPMLTKSTPEGARDYLVPSRVHDGQFFALPQSPQLFKQLLMVAGFDRYYQITKCFRDEDLRADRQPEFTQIDCETAFLDEYEIRDLFENMIRHIFKTVMNVELANPFPVMPYSETMARFGSDKPDLRVKLEFTELTDVMKDVDFKVFSGLPIKKMVVWLVCESLAAQSSVAVILMTTLNLYQFTALKVWPGSRSMRLQRAVMACNHQSLKIFTMQRLLKSLSEPKQKMATLFSSALIKRK